MNSIGENSHPYRQMRSTASESNSVPSASTVSSRHYRIDKYSHYQSSPPAKTFAFENARRPRAKPMRFDGCSPDGREQPRAKDPTNGISIVLSRSHVDLYTPPESPPSSPSQQTRASKPVGLRQSIVEADHRWSVAYNTFDYWVFYRIESLKRKLHQADLRRRCLQIYACSLHESNDFHLSHKMYDNSGDV